ncbi:MAG: hypothetical protein K5843_03515 [Bacteroidales bacterium]|nr:hypothetical protein [Bacteroidales bacterium]
MRKKTLIVSLLLSLVLPARAQFYLAGDDPAHLRWYSVETPHYELIFPEGADSLARIYGRALEQFREPMGRSLGGMTPGEGRRRKMPVVLHTHHVYSNGSVGWAPSRMDLYTHPEFYGADPTSWSTMLASHEPRHQSQLQFGQRGILPWLTGELWAPVYWQVYLDMAVGEGDAVTAETGLAGGTRARTYDFLDFYRAALADGDCRSWDRWRYGSFKHYTPDHYALGYITVAGARTLYDDPLIVREALDLSWKKPWYIAPYNTQKVISQHAGKPFKEAFKDILNHFERVWEADAAARAPFMPSEPVTPDEPYAMSYTSPQWADDILFAIRDSYREARHLVSITKDGKVTCLAPFATNTSALVYEPERHRLYWSETIPHPRWGLSGSSILRYYDIKTGCMKDVTRGTRFYNPQCSPDGTRLLAAEHGVNGETALVIVDVDSGTVLRRHRLPDGIQATDPIWAEGAIYTFGLSEGGYGLYRLTGDGWKTILSPSRQKIGNPGAGDDCLEWESDRSGVNEMYRFFPESGKLLQMTNSRLGGVDYAWEDDCICYNVPVKEGFQIFRTFIRDLSPREVEYDDVHTYVIEDELTAQEKALGPAPDREADVPVTEPKRYRKLAHPLRIHSWLPLYVDYDAVKEASLDYSYETASPGLSLFFQNTLGTFSGMVGYGIHPDPDTPENWRNALHLKMTYTGLYPVIEAQMDLGDRAARMYFSQERHDGSRVTYGLTSVRQGWPLLTGSVRSYVPLRFSKGGIQSGITPQVRLSFSNNAFVTRPIVMTKSASSRDIPSFYRMASRDIEADGVLTTLLSASVRGYVMMDRADSQTYPRWGVGMEGGVGFRPGLTQYYAPNLYGYAYGYLPGFTRLQGLKWTVIGQRKLGDGCRIGDVYANILPRGYEGDVSSLIGQNFDWQWRVTADYAIPIYVGDISIPAVAYIKNFLLTPHADFTGLPGKYNLWSAGADFSASLARLFVLPFDASVGVSVSYLGGSLYEHTGQEKPWSVSMIFGVDF